MEVARTPVKSRIAYIGGTSYIREDWMIYFYQAKPSNTYSLWFRYKESDPARWYEVYKKHETKE